MVSIRCIMCGTPIAGSSPMCAACTEEQVQGDVRSRQGTEEATTKTCQSCLASVQRSVNVCPNCGRSLVASWPTQVEGFQRGDFFIRLVATIIDGIILAIPSIGVQIAAPNGVGILLSLLIRITYDVGFWTATGATPGKMVMGLRIVTREGEPVSFGRALGRYFATWLSGLTLGIGYLMILGEQKLGLHDRVAGTQVVFSNTLPQRELPAPGTLPPSG